MLRIDTTVHIHKPPAQVFAAWASAGALATWFAPMAARKPDVTMDFRIDGRYSIVIPMPDGSVHKTRGRFLEIQRDEKIVMTWQCDAFPDPESIVTVRFIPVTGGTDLNVTHETFDSPDTCSAHRGGWEACLAMLVEQLEETTSAAGETQRDSS